MVLLSVTQPDNINSRYWQFSSEYIKKVLFFSKSNIDFHPLLSSVLLICHFQSTNNCGACDSIVILVSYLFSELPELTNILSKEAVHRVLTNQDQGDNDKILRPLFESLMTCEKASVSNSLQNLINRLEKDGMDYNFYIIYTSDNKLSNVTLIYKLRIYSCTK